MATIGSILVDGRDINMPALRQFLAQLDARSTAAMIGIRLFKTVADMNTYVPGANDPAYAFVADGTVFQGYRYANAWTKDDAFYQGLAAIVQPLVDSAKASADSAALTAQNFAAILKQDLSRSTTLMVEDSSGRIAAQLGSRTGGGRGRIGRMNAKDLTVGKIAGRPASSVVAFFGIGGIRRRPIDILVNISNGQSRGGGTSIDKPGNQPITVSDWYGGLMFKSGVRFWEDEDLSALVPYIERRTANGAETPCGGYQSAMAQMFNAYGVPPRDNPMRIVSMAPNQGETAIEAFLPGTGLYERMLRGVRAVVSLNPGKRVVVGSIKWRHGETRGADDSLYVAQLRTYIAAADRDIRAVTGQTEVVTLLTDIGSFGDLSKKMSEAARLDPLIRISGAAYDLDDAGLAGAQFDTVHQACRGYFKGGFRDGIAEFSTMFLERPWRPNQISRDARGRTRCRRYSADRLGIIYDVPFDGELLIDQSNTLMGGPIPSGSCQQNGFFGLDGNGANIPLRDVTLIGRNELLIVGPNIATVGNTINVGSPLLTRAGSPRSSESSPYPVGTCLRDRMGDTVTIDDLGGFPLHNWAKPEGWTMTAEELGL